MEWPVILGIAAGTALVLLVAVQFNGMVVRRNRCHEAWSNVETELKRRYDLIPNLVRTVCGYARHETRLMRELTRTRVAAARLHGDARMQGKAEKRLVTLLDRLLAVAEAHPDLKASRNFLRLQEELAITEDRIQAARRFYNGNVRDYHDKIRTLPGALFAPLLGFRERPYFQADAVHTKLPQVTKVR